MNRNISPGRGLQSIFSETEVSLLGWTKHCPQTRVGQDRNHLPHSRTHQCLWFEGCEGRHQVFPAHLRIEYWPNSSKMFCLTLPDQRQSCQFNFKIWQYSNSEAYILKNLMFEGKNKRATKWVSFHWKFAIVPDNLIKHFLFLLQEIS